VVRRVLSWAALVAFVCGSLAPARATDGCPAGYITAPTSLVTLYFSAYDDVLTGHITNEPDGTVYVSTGDINAEWLRDSSAVAQAYVNLARNDPDDAKTLRGIIARQAKYILIDPYANAFNPDYTVFEEKYELDSLMYPIWLAYLYWQRTGDTSIFDAQERSAFDKILSVMRVEQHHDQQSKYRNSNLPDGGKGSPVGYTGMVWSGFRPSDDACIYGYLIPSNMFAVVAMHYLTSILQRVYHDKPTADNAWNLSVQIRNGIEKYGKTNYAGFDSIYAYEVDGLGHTNMMDDANVPSLLSIPYFGYQSVADGRYQRTRSFVLSSHDPYYFTGKYATGVGSPHTPRGWVWPLALVVQALTSRSAPDTQQVLGYIANSVEGDQLLHESFDPNDPTKFTRTDFAWPNALYIELITAMRPESQVTTAGTIECFQAPVGM
jgi:meiotically up-regulated gene 157 (Mug157) protein